MKNREYSIEVFRIIMMFGICFLHAISFGKLGSPIYNSAMMFCVNGFVLISGYFGCRFRFSKILALYATAAWCIAVGLLAKIHIAGEALPGRFLDAFLIDFKGYWFLHAYIALMLSAPVFDLAFNSDEASNRRRLWTTALPFIFLVFVWGWVQTLGRNIFGDGVKYFPGIPGYSGGGYAYLVLAGTYVSGRVIRKLEPFGRLATVISAIGLLLCYVATTYLPMWLGINSRIFACYCSPFVLMMAVFAFIVVKAIHVPRTIGLAACWLAPSLFAVYLLQTTKYGIGVIHAIAKTLSAKGWEELCVYFATAFILLVGCIIIDLPRRFVSASLKFILKHLFHSKGEEQPKTEKPQPEERT